MHMRGMQDAMHSAHYVLLLDYPQTWLQQLTKYQVNAHSPGGNRDDDLLHTVKRIARDRHTFAPLMVLMAAAAAEPPAVTFSRVTGALAFFSCARWSPPPQRPQVCLQKPPPTIQAELHLPHVCASGQNRR